MNWLKTSWTALSVGLLAFLAIFAVASAQRQKTIGRKWQQKATDIEEGNVTKGTLTAAAASTKAKLHAAKGEEIKKKAIARVAEMGGKDEDIADILNQFRKS